MNNYHTDDLIEATALFTSGLKFIGLERTHDPRRARFGFTESDDRNLEITLGMYEKRELRLDPISVITNYSFLRDLTRKHNG